MATTPTDRDFDKVDAGSLLEYDCSPEMELSFRGIRLHAPRRVKIAPDPRARYAGAFARIIVCGAYHLDATYLDLRERFLPRVLLVAVDARTHAPFAAPMEALPNALPEPDAFEGLDLEPEDFEGRSVIEYFNPNLAELLSLPEAEAEYLVYATLGSYVSNVVRIDVHR